MSHVPKKNHQEQERVHSSRWSNLLDPGAIGQLQDKAIVHVVNKMPGRRKKKGPRKSSQRDQSAPSPLWSLRSENKIAVLDTLDHARVERTLEV